MGTSEDLLNPNPTDLSVLTTLSPTPAQWSGKGLPLRKGGESPLPELMVLWGLHGAHMLLRL